MSGRWEELRTSLPDLLLGVLVLLFGLLEQANIDVADGTVRWNMVIVVAVIALATGLARRAPGIALVLVWFVCGFQIAFSVPLLITEGAVVAVAFGAARWGNHLTVALSGLSIPLAGGVGVAFLRSGRFGSVFDSERYLRFYDAARQLSDTWQVGAGILATACLAVPWMAGLVLRYSNRASTSRESQVAAEQEVVRAQVETEQAIEIARLREEQARLARDVHDVVGHSLAVILAQAEAAQYLPDDPEQLRSTMATIATSARSSLQDVRQVLSATKQPAPAKGDLDQLIDGIAGSGHRLESSEVGTVQPLPPELAVVAYRVLQEMLTNAITHGRRDHAVIVERHWPDLRWPDEQDLRIEVRNMTGSPDDTGSHGRGGNGLIGMRRRLEAVGGRLDVRRREAEDGVTFTATAWVPVRAR